jgi:putative DNA primase/helicase
MPQHQELTVDDIWSMLMAIPAHDRDDWIRVGMALKSHLGDAGWPLFDDWSATSDSYQASAARSVWRSFRGSGVNIGSLVHMARENGWNRQAPAITAPPSRRAPKPKQSNTARYAAELWLAANKWMNVDDWISHPSAGETVLAHPYTFAKGIDSAGGAGRGIASGSIIGKRADCIIVPIREHGEGKIQGVQCINANGAKQTFGSVSGGYLLLGNTLDKNQMWYVCEGWASAYSMVFHHQNGNSVCACAFGKTQMRKCAEDISDHHKPGEVIILWERD